ncbi:hypothetical protein Ait01nite_027760 [Actinoplanes italicus]|uniref:Uncharacterized protein n=1 Tax=Actinoplanes italicus TaxID=113567 RepID=A0A2T0KEN2_9ACTN|nr:hypothetical protein [Actinoplanes italicus]PRX21852.1 hypothetical protein CLV67_10529 [Actinoplanes italicus]GIE29731.1 hypothetical protein Ait01nite_027760 [Actinoplanes italicus]
MVALIITVLLLLVVTTAILWPMPDATAADKVAASAGTGDDGGRRERVPTTLEGALVAQLLRGEISRGQYHQAVGGLAARDDERNPMPLPGNDRPDATT